MNKERFNITGMTCAACQANIERNVSKLDGIKNVSVNLLANNMTAEYDETVLSSDKIIETVVSIGYGAELPGKKSNENKTRNEWDSRKQNTSDELSNMKKRLILSVVLLVPLMYVSMGGMMRLPMPSVLTGTENSLVSVLVQLLFTVPVIFINRKFYISGFKALRKRSPNMDTLVAIGSGASLVYGLYVIFAMAYCVGHSQWEQVHTYQHSLYLESSAMILTLVTVGKYLEARSKTKTSSALDKLIDLSPKTANVIRNGKEITVEAEKVEQGDIVVIRPGDSIPVDGTVLEGSGYVDQSAITGESIPVEKEAGASVISATVNKNGSFKFKASKVGEDTTLAQIIRLVDEAGSTKAPIARLADKVSGIFVPVVIVISLLTAIVWLIAGRGFEFALTNAVSVLVISCPCALGLATPVAITVGTGKAAEYGILIKSAQSLENLHKTDVIVMDKTGTVTSGKPSVKEIVMLDCNMSEDEFLSEAAAAESGSGHPLAAAVVKEAENRNLAVPAAEGFSSESGRGIKASVNGKMYTAGNMRYINENSIEYDSSLNGLVERMSEQGRTPLIFAVNDKVAAVVSVADTIKDSSRTAINDFKKMGLKTVLLTGDNKAAATAIQKELGIDEVIADVLPQDKESHIKSLMQSGKTVAMIGDGINDAPALTSADIGIAIGAGTDIAVESADIVLMKDSLQDAVTAINLSRSVIKNIKMNLFWAFFYNTLGIPLAAGVLYPFFNITLSPMIASAAMSLSSVSVVTNALRLRFFKTKTNELSSQLPSPESSDKKINDDVKGKIKMTKTLKIDGMMCNHCKMNVEKALQGIDGVSGAVANLEQKQATVTLDRDISNDVLTGAVTEAGYTVLSVE